MRKFVVALLFLHTSTVVWPQSGGFTDHHVHIMSPQLVQLWKSMGIQFGRPDWIYSNIDSVLYRNAASHVRLVAMSYVFTSREFGGNQTGARENTKQENDYLARAKLKYPDRVEAFFAIDPTQEFAYEEAKRCIDSLKLDGMKMHFNASQVSLQRSNHLRSVRHLFQLASTSRIPVLLHFDNSSEDFGERDVSVLIDSILTKLEFLELQIAHFGTSGGFGARTKLLLNAFMEHGGRLKGPHRKVVFDISAVCLTKETDGLRPLTPEEINELAVYCRKIGYSNIVFASDYPLYSAAEYRKIIVDKLRLTDSESKEIFNR